MLFLKEQFESSCVVKSSETIEGKMMQVTVQPISIGYAIINTREQSYKRAGSMPGFQTRKKNPDRLTRLLYA